MKRAYNRQDVANALTGIDKLLQYEGTIANRGTSPLTGWYKTHVVPDIGGDDISEFEGPPEWGLPALLYDPLSNMAKVGAMLMGDMKINPDIITSAAVDAPLMGGLLAGATGAVPRGAVLGANVFHGGPHRWSPEPDFPHGRPRLDKMGTGEGNQAYGYGFYSADAPGVATQYQKGVKNMGEVRRLNDEMSELAKVMDQDSGPGYRNFMSDKGREAERRYDELMAAREAVVSDPGTLYKLDIPDADIAKYLDYDKPLSEQPNIIKKLRAAGFQYFEDKKGGAFADFGDVNTATGKDVFDGLGFDFDEKGISEVLRKAGIPGLKYFDQGSRPLGDTIGQTLVVRGKEIDSDDLTGSFAANRLLESNMDFDAAKRIARGMGQDDVVKVLDDWATTPDKVSIKDKRTRNYVTWDQDVLNRSKMLERDGVTLGANKGPTAALPGLLSDAAQGRIRNSRVRDRLSDDQQAAIVQAANTAHEDRLDLAQYVGGDSKFDLDQILVDNDLAVEFDGFVQEGHVFLNDIDIPAGAKEGDILPISAVKKGARFVFPDGSEKDFSPNPGGPFRSDDLGVELVNLDEDGFADIVLRDRNAVEDRILADTVAEDAVTTLEDALGHSDHHARAAAFRKILDELGIEYNKAGIEGVNSEYVYVPTKWDVDGDPVEDLLKIRFADHTRQSGLHEPADYNIADGGYDDAISALDDIVQKISGVRTEMFSNPATAALPSLLSQQDWMNSADQVTQDTRNLLSKMLQNKARIDRERQFYESGGI